MSRNKLSYICIVISALCFIQCSSSSKSPSVGEQHEYTLSEDQPEQSEETHFELLDSTTFNFHNINAGDTVKHTFRFRNTGKLPIIISNAVATCGCTVARYNKNPIAPGKTDSIEAVFISSEDMKGFQNKVVTVQYNSPKSPKLFTLYGHVN